MLKFSQLENAGLGHTYKNLFPTNVAAALRVNGIIWLMGSNETDIPVPNYSFITNIFF